MVDRPLTLINLKMGAKKVESQSRGIDPNGRIIGTGHGLSSNLPTRPDLNNRTVPASPLLWQGSTIDSQGL